MEIKIIIVIK